MKKIITIFLLFLFTSQFAVAELTKQDLKEIEALLDKQEKRIKEYIDIKIEAVNARIDATNTRIDATNTRIDSVEKGQDFLKWMIGILALVIVAGIAFPPIWQEWRERRKSSLTQRVAKLEQEVDDLKQRKIYQG